MSVPPLPQIEGNFDLFLDVHTHRSLRTITTRNEEWGNTDRLAELGLKVLEMAVTYHLFALRPCIEADEIRTRMQEYTSHQTIDGWLEAYRLKQKLRVHPAESDNILSSQTEMTAFFHTYVGAVCFVKGFEAVQIWISRLIDPNAQICLPPQDGRMPGHQTQNQASSSGYMSMDFSPTPPAGAPPPLPNSPSSSSSTSSSSSMGLVTLALVNQTATKKGFDINYIATQDGPSHLPTWTVKCTINGADRGVGIARSQKLAKEEAARRAWVAMGW